MPLNLTALNKDPLTLSTRCTGGNGQGEGQEKYKGWRWGRKQSREGSPDSGQSAADLRGPGQSAGQENPLEAGPHVAVPSFCSWGAAVVLTGKRVLQSY